jgi:hypothetical protein
MMNPARAEYTILEEVLDKRQTLVTVAAVEKVICAAGGTLMVLGLVGATLACAWLLIRDEWLGVIDMDEFPGLDVTGWGSFVAAIGAVFFLIGYLPNLVACRDRFRWYLAGLVVNVLYWCAWPAFHVVRERYFDGRFDPAINIFLSRLFAPVRLMLRVAKIIVPEQFGLYVFLYVLHVFIAVGAGTVCWSAGVAMVQRLADSKSRNRSAA